MFSLWRNVTAAIKVVKLVCFVYESDGLKLNPERMARVALQMLYIYLNRIAYHKKRTHDYKTLLDADELDDLVNDRSSTWFRYIFLLFSVCVCVSSLSFSSVCNIIFFSLYNLAYIDFYRLIGKLFRV